MLRGRIETLSIEILRSVYVVLSLVSCQINFKNILFITTGILVDFRKLMLNA